MRSIVRIASLITLLVVTLARISTLTKSIVTHHKVSLVESYDSIPNINVSEMVLYMEQQLDQLINESTIITWSDEHFQPFYSMFDIDYVPDYGLFEGGEKNATFQELRNSIWNDTTRRFIKDSDLIQECAEYFLEADAKGRQKKSHVLFVQLDTNWGALSNTVPNRTCDWGEEADEEWKENRNNVQDNVINYLNDAHMLGIITTQHQRMDHPKVHSIPLGILPDGKSDILSVRKEKPLQDKSKLLTINDSGWEHRKEISETVIANFAASFNSTSLIRESQPSLVNTYESGRHLKSVYREIRASKFVLCPSGLGWDSYRVWEVLTLGSFPVMEHYHRNDSFYRTLDKLPVLWVAHFSEVTPELLKRAYPELLSQAEEYQFERLTQWWWRDFIHTLARIGKEL